MINFQFTQAHLWKSHVNHSISFDMKAILYEETLVSRSSIIMPEFLTDAQQIHSDQLCPCFLWTHLHYRGLPRDLQSPILTLKIIYRVLKPVSFLVSRTSSCSSPGN